MRIAVCQSCGMPMKSVDFSTNQDGSINTDYCHYCYSNGAFTSDQTMEEMVETCVGYLAHPSTGYTETQARAHLQEIIPKLKRWTQPQ